MLTHYHTHELTNVKLLLIDWYIIYVPWSSYMGKYGVWLQWPIHDAAYGNMDGLCCFQQHVSHIASRSWFLRSKILGGTNPKPARHSPVDIFLADAVRNHCCMPCKPSHWLTNCWSSQEWFGVTFLHQHEQWLCHYFSALDEGDIPHFWMVHEWQYLTLVGLLGGEKGRRGERRWEEMRGEKGWEEMNEDDR